MTNQDSQRCEEVLQSALQHIHSSLPQMPADLDDRTLRRAAAQRHPHRWRYAAAMVAVAMVTAAALAMLHRGGFLLPQHPTETPSTVEDLPLVIQWDDAPLDSMLLLMSAHYGVQVQYRDTQYHALHLLYTWHTDQPLPQVLQHLNHFDRIHLRLEDDVLIVDTPIHHHDHETH